MKILLDTSTLVAGLVEDHPAHERALPWLQRIKNGSNTGVISAHTLAELYAILTSLPLRPRLTPRSVQRLIEDDVLACFEVIPLTESDYQTVISRLSDLGITGDAVYDALIAQAAVNASVDQVVTLNQRDFLRVHPELASKIISP
jgi:predicted nucleic acid-binding protein